MTTFYRSQHPRGSYVDAQGRRCNLVAERPGAAVHCPESGKATADTEAEAAAQLGLTVFTEKPTAAQAEAAYAKALAAGIAVGGITLAAGSEDQILFLQGAVLLDVAEKLAADAEAFRQSPVSAVFGRPVVDRGGQPHDPTVTEYRQLVAAYGQEIGRLQGVRNAAIAADLPSEE